MATRSPLPKKSTNAIRPVAPSRRTRPASSAASFTTIELACAHGVAVIWLDRQAVRNAFDSTMLAELSGALDTIERDTSVRAVVLAARGPVFSAGADIKEPRTARANGAPTLSDLLARLDTFPRPVVARVQGAAFGGAVAFIAACDVAVADAAAEFSIGEVRLGIAPGAVAPYVVRAIGTQAARRYCLTGERFGASEAWRLGLVHEIVAAGELDATVNTLLGHLVQGGPNAIALTKQLVASLDAQPLSEATIRAANHFHHLSRDTAEAAEGLAAFRERRPPAWVPND